MRDRIFIDTNILVYASTSKDKPKQQMALNYLKKCLGCDVYVSTQVLSEFYSALKKNGIDDATSRKALESYASTMTVLPVTLDTIKIGLDIRDSYKYSLWDCLIISSALSVNCNVLCSEDMSNKQIINSQVKIFNPFTQ